MKECACGCGEKINEEYVWYEIEGEAYATIKCWEKDSESNICYANDTVELWDGARLSFEAWKSEYEVVEHG